ncbi:type I restriction enzyme S subunit [Pontibacter ummariensis]|uniref:Type I restriction enzyme, S subunit n=1 Tax=Pontibacter ummariensis TaxID=1610492 RepID=A0A239LC26_9BACT|nr:restriction endonuclease subunit S [Pontibacter ummariensis]PRY03667.1 type I restriction enzyme S subunit [Pontibacter ummariensis]SNT28186.1 type I restriction enzyme, S subunit [Pontibacter ummariensis]
MKNWKTYSLSEVVDKGRGVSYGIVQPGTFVNDGVPIIKVNNLTDRKLSYSDVQKVKLEVEAKYQRTKLRGNEILISLVGSLGHVAKVNVEMIGWNVARAVGVLPVAESFDKEWIYWFLKSPQAQNFVHSQATTSVQATLNLKELQELQIAYPDEAYRKKATEILSALDDKIELNRRMNQTLEQMAQTLFRQYFVDGIDEENQEPISLLKFANLIGGGTPKTSVKEYWDGNILWVSAKDVTPNDGTFIVETEKKITELGLSKSSAKLIPQFSTVITARGTVGKICIATSEMTISQSNYALKAKGESADFVLFQIIQHQIEELQRNSYGTVFDTITTNTLRDIKITIPAQDIVLALEEKLKLLYMKILSNLKENIILSKTRDSLLPKLMSGEIDVMQIKPEELHEPVLS